MRSVKLKPPPKLMQLIVMPAGEGKTRLAAEACRQHVNAGGRVLWLAHRRELIEQVRDTLERGGRA